MSLSQSTTHTAKVEIERPRDVIGGVGTGSGSFYLYATSEESAEDAREMLRFDLDNENETIRNYRERVQQCEALGEYAMAEQIRQIIVEEQDHQIDLATALGEDVPDINTLRKRTG